MNHAVKIIQSETMKKEAGKTLHTTTEYANNPQQAIIDFVAAFIDNLRIAPAKLLVATYRQPEKTSSGIIKTQRFVDEDMFQGVVGLVIKLGPLSFANDKRIDFGGFTASLHEWVVYKPDNGHATELRGLHCRFISDTDILGATEDPEILW